MTGILWRGLLISGLGLSAASQAFAALLQWNHALGPPLGHITSSLPFYAPWAIGLWAWRWYPQGRVAFWLAGVAGVVTMALTAILLRPPRRKPGDAHWATLQELREADCLGQPGHGVVLGLRHGRVLRYAGPGHVFFVGRTRCHAPGTEILMADGSRKKIEDIVVGDRVMGPDSLPRTITSLHAGAAEMVRITPKRGEPFVVTLDHILSLYRTNDGTRYAKTTTMCSVRDWLVASGKYQHLHNLYRVGVEFPAGEPLPLHPYILGVLLGDGSMNGGTVWFYNNNVGGLLKKIAALLERTDVHIVERKRGDSPSCRTFAIVRRKKTRWGGRRRYYKDNAVLVALRELGLWGSDSASKFIPESYKRASKEDRLWLLAGLMDTDGSLAQHNAGYLPKLYDYISKSEQLARDVQFVARSLGLASYVQPCIKQCVYQERLYSNTYYRVSIFGQTSIIPCQVYKKQVRARHKATKGGFVYKYSPMVTGFTAEQIGHGPYYGFTCDGDQLYLTSDFIVHHNSGKSTQLLSTLLDSTASMLLKDDKQELYPCSAGYRATLGPVYRLAPTEPVSDGYNPWEGIDVHAETAYRDLALISGYLVEHQTHGQPSSGAYHFQTMATQVLTALARYGLTTELATCGAELLTLADTSWTTLATLLLEQEDAEVQAAGQLLRELAPEPLGDLRSTVTNALGVFRDPRVARMTRTSSYPRGALRSGDRPVTVYWQVPFVDQDRLRPLTRLFWHQTLQDCTSQLTGWRQRLQVVFEELPSLHYFPMASEGLNYAAGYGVQFLILTPSLEELTRWYTVHHNFLVGCHVQAIFGLNDAATARTVSERLGTTTVRKRRTTRQGGTLSVSEEEQREPLLSTTGVLQVPEDDVLLLVGRHATLASQCRFYQHRPWKQRATLAVPERTGHVALGESGGRGDGDAA